MPGAKLKQFLDEKGVHYSVITHSPAFTAQQKAAMTHISGKELAKTVVVKCDDDFAMVVLPAHHLVDVPALARTLGGDIRLPTEAEFQRLFPECDLGALPPFGNLFGLAVWVAEPLTRDEEIAFTAGSHTEVIRMRYVDYARLVRPQVGTFSRLATSAPAHEAAP